VSEPPPPATHVLCVGVRDDESKDAGDISAHRVFDALSRFRSVKSATYLPLNTQNTAFDNRVALEEKINSIRAAVAPGDSFVFYIACHGGYDTIGDELPVLSEYKDEIQRGDERLGLSTILWNKSQNISDDDFSALFLDSKWQDVNKLFIIDCCFSGGFFGKTDLGDTGDLAGVSKTALIASASEGKFSYSTLDEDMNLAFHNLGTAFVNVLTNLKDQDRITYQELFDGIQNEGKQFQGLDGYINDLDDLKSLWGVEMPMSFGPTGTFSQDFELTLGIPEPTMLALLTVGWVVFLLRRK